MRKSLSIPQALTWGTAFIVGVSLIYGQFQHEVQIPIIHGGHYRGSAGGWPYCFIRRLDGTQAVWPPILVGTTCFCANAIVSLLVVVAVVGVSGRWLRNADKSLFRIRRQVALFVVELLVVYLLIAPAPFNEQWKDGRFHIVLNWGATFLPAPARPLILLGEITSD